MCTCAYVHVDVEGWRETGSGVVDNAFRRINLNQERECSRFFLSCADISQRRKADQYLATSFFSPQILKMIAIRSLVLFALVSLTFGKIYSGADVTAFENEKVRWVGKFEEKIREKKRMT